MRVSSGMIISGKTFDMARKKSKIIALGGLAAATACVFLICISSGVQAQTDGDVLPTIEVSGRISTGSPANSDGSSTTTLGCYKCPFEIYDESDLPSTLGSALPPRNLLGSGTTEGDGSFAIDVDLLDVAGTELEPMIVLTYSNDYVSVKEKTEGAYTPAQDTSSSLATCRLSEPKCSADWHVDETADEKLAGRISAASYLTMAGENLEAAGLTPSQVGVIVGEKSIGYPDSDANHYDHSHQVIRLTKEHARYQSIVFHEYGHFIHHGLAGFGPFPSACPSNGWQPERSTAANCAWTEGLATFIALYIQDDPIYYEPLHEMEFEGFHDDHSFSYGDPHRYPGLVTATLWDLYDYPNQFDNQDGSHHSFSDIMAPIRLVERHADENEVGKGFDDYAYWWSIYYDSAAWMDFVEVANNNHMNQAGSWSANAQPPNPDSGVPCPVADAACYMNVVCDAAGEPPECWICTEGTLCEICAFGEGCLLPGPLPCTNVRECLPPPPCSDVLECLPPTPCSEGLDGEVDITTCVEGLCSKFGITSNPCDINCDPGAECEGPPCSGATCSITECVANGVRACATSWCSQLVVDNCAIPCSSIIPECEIVEVCSDCDACPECDAMLQMTYTSFEGQNVTYYVIAVDDTLEVWQETNDIYGLQRNLSDASDVRLL